MKILFNTHVLVAGKKSKEIPFQLCLNGQKEIQIAKTIRAPLAQTFDRGNGHIELSFSVGKRHPSTEAAEKYLLLHPELLHTPGDLILELENPENERYMLKNACIQKMDSSLTGQVSFHRYTIVGDAFRKV
ncbi:MAG: hypothetical protein LBR62_02430 [Puniceicoccales bacterium]|jgi:hypothetical protein|nr:hypothetical protein [Puniceicoccales bacterium]